MMRLQPLGSRVVVTPDEEKETSEGGVHLPDTAVQRPEMGTIEAVGPGRMLDNGTILPIALQRGDRVVFSRYAGSDIRLGQKKFLLFEERDILILIHNDPEG